MKNTIYIVLILLLFSCKGQQAYAQYSLANLSPFIGTWEHQENNKIFRVNIFEDGGYLKGEYKLVEIGNGIETVLYKSDYFIPGTDFQWREAIFGGSEDGVKMGAQIVDNSINYENGLAHHKFKRGSLGFTIQPQTCSNCAVTAVWIVKPYQGLRLDTEPDNYNIPTNIVLTKVQ